VCLRLYSNSHSTEATRNTLTELCAIINAQFYILGAGSVESDGVCAGALQEDGTGGRMRPSKSDTSLTDSFVMVGEGDVSDMPSMMKKDEGQRRRRNPQNILREGE
jgi:hypothetical protein